MTLLQANAIDFLHHEVLKWYDANQRVFPWRTAVLDPYATWISETMLQQTGAAVVVAYFERFMRRFPTVQVLAEAPLEAVFLEWQGLGYYRRAAHLHQCAKALVEQHHGVFPRDGLQKLPGVGPYTAAALRALFWDEPVLALDGPSTRLLTRYTGIEKRRLVSEVPAPLRRSGDFAQGLMDLATAFCRARAPLCTKCPLEKQCLKKEPPSVSKPLKPIKNDVAHWIERDGSVWLEKRPVGSLLGGTWMLPVSEGPTDLEVVETVRHTFTHFHWRLHLVQSALQNGSGQWTPLDALETLPLSSCMRKLLKAAERLKFSRLAQSV